MVDMIDFACKRFDLDGIVKCSLGLTRGDFLVLKFFLDNKKSVNTREISEKLGLNLTTVQKAVLKLRKKGILIRGQENLKGGGYVFVYGCAGREKVRGIIRGIVRDWAKKVDEGIGKW